MEGQLALEFDVTTFFRRLFLVGCTYPYSHCKASYLGPTTSEVMAQDAASLIMAFEKTRLYYVSRDWQISYVVHDSQSGVMTDKLQSWVKRRGVMPAPSPSGDHPHRVERRRGALRGGQ